MKLKVASLFSTAVLAAGMKIFFTIVRPAKIPFMKIQIPFNASRITVKILPKLTAGK